jgi:hypothetical protein
VRDFFLFGTGLAAMLIGALVVVPLMNVTLGPSANTIMSCKELEKEGYLVDECFYEDGMLKPECYRQRKRGGS